MKYLCSFKCQDNPNSYCTLVFILFLAENILVSYVLKSSIFEHK